MVELRYYGDALEKEEHEKVVDLLNKINEKWDISVEIVRIRKEYRISSFRGKIREESKIAAYNRDFSNNRILSRNIGVAPSKEFKTRGGTIVIQGVVGVVKNDTLQWATRDGIGFLEDFLENGFDAVRRREVEFGKKPPELHDELFKFLVSSNLPESRVGKKNKYWFREIAVGFSVLGIREEDRRMEYDENVASRFGESDRRRYRKMCELGMVDRFYYRGVLQEFLSRRYGFGPALMPLFVDYVVLVGDKRVWLLEGKEKLNEKAIGQLFVYKDLFEKDYSFFDEVSLGAVVKSGILNPTLFRFCEEHNINVFSMERR